MKSIKFSLLAAGSMIAASLALMTSCLGAAADIVMRADGSGSIALEYRVSPMLESLGRLDGNERWPAIPVGRADFERSVARVPGLRLSSFSVKEAPRAAGGADLLTRVTLDFQDAAALAAFLDSSGSRAALVSATTLRLVLSEPAAAPLDADLLSLLREIAAGYEISVSFRAPRAAALSAHPPAVSAARIVSPGKKVSFAIGTGELAGLQDGLAIEIRW